MAVGDFGNPRRFVSKGRREGAPGATGSALLSNATAAAPELAQLMMKAIELDEVRVELWTTEFGKRGRQTIQSLSFKDAYLTGLTFTGGEDESEDKTLVHVSWGAGSMEATKPDKR